MMGRFCAPEIEKNGELGKSPNLRLLYAIATGGKIRLARIIVSDYHAGVKCNESRISRMTRIKRDKNDLADHGMDAC
jgi:hypothetical protein